MPLRIDRRPGQCIVVPGDTEADDVVVRVHELRGDRVRLEVVAHPEQAIYRGELWKRLNQQERNHDQSTDGR